MRRTLDKIKQRWYRTRGYNAKTIRGLPLKCDPDHVRLWRRMANGRWEPQTLDVLAEHLTPDSVFYDIGAWIGPTVLYAAPRCRQVYCFEPDHVAYHYLLWNLHLNRLTNVTPFNIAISTENGLQPMSSFGEAAGDSQSSLLNPRGNEGIPVFCMTLKAWLEMVRPAPANFIKMDIEGAEFDLLPAIADYLDRYQPALYLSTHGHLLPQAGKKDRMKKLMAVTERYGRCLDEAGRPVPMDELLSDHSLQRARTFLLSD